MSQLNGVFETFFYQFCNFSKWIFAIRMASDIIKQGSDNNIQGAVKSIMNGGISYGCLYSIIYILNSVESAFRG